MKDVLYLINILESIGLIKTYLKSKKLEDLENSNLLRDAVCKRIEDIGENMKKISPKIKKSYTKIDWIAFIETRNFLTHVYQRVNIQKLWGIIIKDIPVLEIEIKRILEKLK
jgi:uncharacterized protein with HEPN domain